MVFSIACHQHTSPHDKYFISFASLTSATAKPRKPQHGKYLYRNKYFFEKEREKKKMLIYIYLYVCIFISVVREQIYIHLAIFIVGLVPLSLSRIISIDTGFVPHEYLTSIIGSCASYVSRTSKPHYIYIYFCLSSLNF